MNINTERFRPIKDTMQPDVRVPTIPPIELIDPIHEISSVSSGPDSNGVSFEDKIGIAVVGQAATVPCENIIKSTGNYLKIM